MPGIDVIVPVRNGVQTVGALIERLLELPVPAGWSLQLIVVDDASSDGTLAELAARAEARLQVVTLQQCGGRANARNQGAARATGDYLLFLDADCVPASAAYLGALAAQAGAGADLIYGPIGASGGGFWARYLEEVEIARRARALARDHLAAMTSANLLVSRALFERVGGFRGDYRHYGFEDKDLIVRLLTQQPRVVFEPQAKVAHKAGNTVSGYCRKMREAARWSAPLFAAEHPAVYRGTLYGRLDSDFAPAPLRPLLRQVGRWWAGGSERLAVWAVERDAMPWALRASLVRAAAAFNYLLGCAER